MQIDSYHLPGLDAQDVSAWQTMEYAQRRVTLRFPVLRPGAITRLAARLTTARAAHLAPLTTGDIIETIDRAAARLADPRDPLRRLADDALPAITGYTPPMIALVLERAIEEWRTPVLQQLLCAELAHPTALDNFVPHGETGVLTRAVGPRHAFHIFSGNVPGVAVTSIVRSLLVKAATLGKTASGEPLLPVLFARALSEVAPGIGDCLAVCYWRPDSPAHDEALRAADAVIVYGGREAVADVRSRMPAGVRLIEHGPRISFGIVGAQALTDDAAASAVAASAARATALFDQQGCVSPHLLYVEEDAPTAPRAFARMLARALERLADELPRGTLTPAEAAAIHDARAEAEFRGIDGQEVELFADSATGYTVVYDPRTTFEASCLNRFIRVKPVASLDDIAGIVAPFADVLQTVAVAGAGERTVAIAARLAEIGVSRITTFDSMPWPPATWHHDGRGPLNELLRWTDWENGTVTGNREPGTEHRTGAP
jgi:hypothetical protein